MKESVNHPKSIVWKYLFQLLIPKIFCFIPNRQIQVVCFHSQANLFFINHHYLGEMFRFQLRYLQTLSSISSENNTTVIFPLPLDILAAFVPQMKHCGHGQKGIIENYFFHSKITNKKLISMNYRTRARSSVYWRLNETREKKPNLVFTEATTTHTSLAIMGFGKAGGVDGSTIPTCSRGLPHVSGPSNYPWLVTTKNRVHTPYPYEKNELLLNEYLSDFMHLKTLFNIFGNSTTSLTKWGKFHTFLNPHKLINRKDKQHIHQSWS